MPARRAGILAGVALVAGLALAVPACASPAPSDAGAGTPPTTAPAAPTPAPEASATPEVTAPPVPVLGIGAEPTRVSIPVIGLDESLVRLGVLADGTMGVPADWDRVGWFTGGGRPGGRGPTVIAGHVDSGTAPAVFARLGEVGIGDEMQVTDVAGATWTYRVAEVADFPKASFPTVRVFGALGTDELRLVTCSGFFDPAAAAYEDNRVVFAERVA